MGLARTLLFKSVSVRRLWVPCIPWIGLFFLPLLSLLFQLIYNVHKQKEKVVLYLKNNDAGVRLLQCLHALFGPCYL